MKIHKNLTKTNGAVILMQAKKQFRGDFVYEKNNI